MWAPTRQSKCSAGTAQISFLVSHFFFGQHCGKPDGEGRSFAGFALHADVAAHHAAEVAGDSKPESCATVLTRWRRIELCEGLEEGRLLPCRYPYTCIADAKGYPVALSIIMVTQPVGRGVGLRLAGSQQADGAPFGEFAGVAQHIREALFQFVRVSVD